MVRFVKYLQYKEDNKVNTLIMRFLVKYRICMLDNDSYNGNYKKNPFNIQYYKLTQIGISVDGEEIPFKPLKLNFDYKLFATAYNTLFSGTGKLHGNGGSIMKKEDYSEGYTIIVIDLTRFEIGDNFDLKTEGTLGINLVFKTPLAATIMNRNAVEWKHNKIQLQSAFSFVCGQYCIYFCIISL